MLVEAGSLSKAIEIAHVVPYRLNLSSTEVRPPISQFQGVDATKEGTYKLIEGINSCADDSVPLDRISVLFEKMWPDLDVILRECISMEVGDKVPGRDSMDYLREILELVRQQRIITTQQTENPEQVLAHVYQIITKMYNADEDAVDELIENCGKGYKDTGSKTAHRCAEIARFWRKLKWG